MRNLNIEKHNVCPAIKRYHTLLVLFLNYLSFTCVSYLGKMQNEI